MMVQSAWICSRGSTLSSVMAEVECGTRALFSRRSQAEHARRPGERVYYIVLTVAEVFDE